MNKGKSTAATLLHDLFETHFSETPTCIQRLPISGSSREYYRISSDNHTVIGTHNSDISENKAFLYLSKHFLQKALPVPRVYTVNDNHTAYLQEDLGDQTLFDYINKNKFKHNFPELRKKIYRKVLQFLIQIQTEGAKGLDFTQCYPRAEFDRQSVMWDLNYFKYLFVKPAGISFSEQALENDFERFTDVILKAPADYFLFRDFQSRNIMYADDTITFIDYQGGRKGALQYDLASLLYDAKAELPEAFRTEMLDFYTELVAQHTSQTAEQFKLHYKPFVFLRIMQAMGAYGFRGLVERKSHFILSIAPAQKNLLQLLENATFLDTMPELKKVLRQIAESDRLTKLSESAKLKVSITSFSYKRGLPYDTSGNGGGFVFDCRFLNNPGRIEKYKYLTGRDAEVISFLKNNSEADAFAQSCFNMIQPAIQNYIERQFTSLTIAFGCTGGRHRSVYLADCLTNMLKANTNITVTVKHLEQNFSE